MSMFIYWKTINFYCFWIFINFCFFLLNKIWLEIKKGLPSILFCDSPFIFIIFITMYWLWQNIWQLLLFYKVHVITDYESLFNLQAHLSNYESSVLIRIIYYVISNPSLNMAGLVSCIKLIDIMGIVGLLILAQKYRIIMILNVFK